MDADANIRTRAKRELRRNGVQFDNDISNSMLIALSKLCKRAAKNAKEIERQKQIAMKCFDTLTPSSWMSANKIQVKEIMKQTGGSIVKYHNKYWVSFRPAWKAVSHFVFEKSGCQKGDYYVCLAAARTHHPYRDW